MHPFRPYHPEETQLFGYIDPEDVLAPDDPARFVDDFVERLDVSAFSRRYSQLGRKAFDPRLHLKLFLYGYMEGVFSSRRLALRCRRDLAFVFLCRGQAPDFRTIARFRTFHREQMREVFEQTVALARDLGMVALGRVALDSTTIKANAAKEATVERSAIEKDLAKVDEYLRRLTEEDEREDQALGQEHESEGSLPPELADAEARKARIAAAMQKRQRLEKARKLAQEQEAGRTEEDGKLPAKRFINTTDPDATMRRDGATGKSGPGYGCQTMMSEDGMIVETFAGPQSDVQALAEAVSRTEALVGETLEGKELYADSNYYSVENIENLVGLGIEPMIPDQERAGAMQGKKRKAPAVREGFCYDAKTDSFSCPAGERLDLHGTINEKAGATQGARTRNVYQNQAACQKCPARQDCCKGPFPYKTIKVTGNPGRTEAYLSRFDNPQGRRKYQFRRSIEKIFGHIKGNLRLRQFLCRGLDKVQAEWSLLCTAYNLTRLRSRILGAGGTGIPAKAAW